MASLNSKYDPSDFRITLEIYEVVFSDDVSPVETKTLIKTTRAAYGKLTKLDSSDNKLDSSEQYKLVLRKKQKLYPVKNMVKFNNLEYYIISVEDTDLRHTSIIVTRINHAGHA